MTSITSGSQVLWARYYSTSGQPESFSCGSWGWKPLQRTATGDSDLTAGEATV